MGLLSIFLMEDSNLLSSFLADVFLELVGVAAIKCPRTFQGASEMLRVEPLESGTVDFLSTLFASNRKETHFSTLSTRSRLDAFWSISWSAEVCAEILEEMTVISSAKPFTV